VFNFLKAKSAIILAFPHAICSPFRALLRGLHRIMLRMLPRLFWHPAFAPPSSDQPL